MGLFHKCSTYLKEVKKAGFWFGDFTKYSELRTQDATSN